MRIDAGRLRAFLDCMHLEADQRDKHSAQIREIVKAAKDAGYDPKAVRKVFVRERMDDAERSKQDDLLESYEGALGPKGAALRAIAQGATLDEAAAATGLGRATVARARAVSRKGSNDTAEVSREGGNDTPPHDPDTGEVHDGKAEADADAATAISGVEAGEGRQQRESGHADGHVIGPEEVGDGAHAARGVQRLQPGERRASEDPAALRVATQLRAQIPTSTDPVRLEREAAALEIDQNEVQESSSLAAKASGAESPSGPLTSPDLADAAGGVACPGTHSGGDAQDETGVGGNVCTDECSGRPTGAPVPESCGEPAAALGAKAPLPASDSPTAPLRPHDTPRGGSSTGRTSPFQGEDAGSSPVPRSNNTALDTRGEARPSLEDSEATWFSTLQRSRQEGRV